jgi:hypothetical protein
MKHAAQLGIIGMLGGTVGGYLVLMKGFGLVGEGIILGFLGALFIGLVVGVFTFLLGLVISGKK